MSRVVRGWYKGKPRLTTGVCRDCKDAMPVDRTSWNRTPPPRCVSCGGQLDRKGVWNKSGSIVSAERDLVIPYPEQESEFEVHAWLWYRLRELGIDARGEVQSCNRSARFDIVIFDKDRKAVRLIEVKSLLKKTGFDQKSHKLRHKQAQRYSKFGIRLDTIVGMKAAEAYLAQIKAELGLP